MVKPLSLAMVLGLAATSVAQTTAQRAMRFAAMDTNRDGVITRQEWRGSAQSFATHDWNGDGILSGDEVRPGGRRAAPSEPETFESPSREYTFTDWTARGFAGLDHNRDGRVTRDEWHFAVEDFRRADHNGDGWLSRAEFTASDLVDDDRGDRFSNLTTAACHERSGTGRPTASHGWTTIVTAYSRARKCAAETSRRRICSRAST
jgi:hypothetical protein